LLLPPPDVEGDGLDSDGLLSSARSLARWVSWADGLDAWGNVAGAGVGGFFSENLGVEDGAREEFARDGSETGMI
jgi:hypothetical protein